MSRKERENDQEQLLLYLDGALDGDATEVLRQKLETTPGFRAELEALRHIRNDLQAMGHRIGQEASAVSMAADVSAAVNARGGQEAPVPPDFLDRDAFLADILDQIEGPSDLDNERAFRERLEISPVHRQEYELVVAIITQLEDIGDGVSRRLPKVDLIEPVMGTIARERRHPVTPLADFRQRRITQWTRGLTAAAAAIALLTCAWLVYQNQSSKSGDVQLAQPDPVTVPTQRAGNTEDQIADSQQSLSDLLKDLAAMETPLPTGQESIVVAAAPLEDFNAKGIYTLRQQAFTDDEARARLANLGRLSPDVARRITDDDEASSRARVGAALMLETGDGAAPLVEAVGQLEEVPFTQLAVAQTALGEVAAAVDDPAYEPGLTLEDALSAITTLQDQDPDNGLPHFLEAATRFQTGDEDGAIAALSEASIRQQAWPYAGVSAEFQAEALTAAGMDGDAARAVAALTVGSDEYHALTGLGNQLLAVGDDYAQAGDTASAQIVVESVDQLGQQLQSGSDYANVVLAGLDIQQQALETLDILLPPEVSNVVLTAEAQALVEGIEEINRFFQWFETVLAAELVEFEEEVLSFISDVILAEGDRNLEESLVN